MTNEECTAFMTRLNRLVQEIDTVRKGRGLHRLQTVADRARMRLVATGEGNITVSDLRAVVDQQLADGTWRYGLLYDFIGATAAVTATEMRALAAHIEALPSPKRGPVAVVTEHPALFGMARMYSMLTEAAGLRFQVFRDRPSAEHWLDEQQLIHG